jgi:ABC-type multidrug transport system ATPase subunit
MIEQPNDDYSTPGAITPEMLAVEAAGLGLHGRDRWAYRNVGLSLSPSSVLVAAGHPGSGRSSLLLTLAGRMRPTDGRLTVFGYAIPRQAREVRRLASVARIGGAVELETRLTTAEALSERSLLDVVDHDIAEERFGWACDLLGLSIHRHAHIEELTVADRTLLALALALVSAPRLVVIDDVDEGLRPNEARKVWPRIRAVSGSGVTVAASATDISPAHRAGAGAGHRDLGGRRRPLRALRRLPRRGDRGNSRDVHPGRAGAGCVRCRAVRPP